MLILIHCTLHKKSVNLKLEFSVKKVRLIFAFILLIKLLVPIQSVSQTSFTAKKPPGFSWGDYHVLKIFGPITQTKDFNEADFGIVCERHCGMFLHQALSAMKR